MNGHIKKWRTGPSIQPRPNRDPIVGGILGAMVGGAAACLALGVLAFVVGLIPVIALYRNVFDALLDVVGVLWISGGIALVALIYGAIGGAIGGAAAIRVQRTPALTAGI